VDVAHALDDQRALDLRLAASIGIAEWVPGEEPIDLLRAADRALLDAKQEGRDAVRHASGRFRRE
jgi:PleD family two-component response regulator